MLSTAARGTSIEVQPDVSLHVEIIDKNNNEDNTIDCANTPTIVFLHYWGGSTRTWSKVIPLVHASEEHAHHAHYHYRTVAIDFRGWGESTGPSHAGAYSIAHLAADIDTVLERLQLTTVYLVGLSMGAKVAQAVAGRGNVKGLRGLVLVSPAPPTPLVLPPEASEQQVHAYETWQSAEFVARNVLLSSPEAIDDELLKQVVGDMLRGKAEAKAAWPAYAMGEDISPLAGRIKVPVQVVAAAKDVVEPLERVKTEVCANIETCGLVVLPGAGHLSPLEAPEEVSKYIVDFIGGLEDVGPRAQ
ncbi:alpha/beta-hydrolase [Cryphonectria parasitica EP155]|uniref:Alpha/beta-hydrolase n=1 Tax=Cryphonectria parasitica (strain ATCC 38755 / EP155) TaxID=660469 RepID=A0A9P4Y564_CRYP1|nr:alpha/beta-hydrolase [Cryphonectria parasitica EP155]KAF3766706.1 alpha/beta-hydrolase [Cryphonectria parasitica EP155]